VEREIRTPGGDPDGGTDHQDGDLKEDEQVIAMAEIAGAVHSIPIPIRRRTPQRNQKRKTPRPSPASRQNPARVDVALHARS
jgi:hypothetical protein